MPIKGLTDSSRFGEGLPRIAKLFKGDERPEDGKRPGRDLDYFRVEFDPQFAQQEAELRAAWMSLYGEEPREFENIYLAHATADNAFPNWYEEWTKTALLHRCDGETQVRHFDQPTGAYSDDPIACAQGSEPPCACKPTGRLNIFLPDFIEQVGILGYIQISTHSIKDIAEISRYLADIEKMVGGLTGVPFVVGRSPQDMSVPDAKSGGRRTVTKHMLYIRVTSEFTQHHLLPILAGAKPAPAQRLQQASLHQLPAEVDTPPESNPGDIKTMTDYVTGEHKDKGQKTDDLDPDRHQLWVDRVSLNNLLKAVCMELGVSMTAKEMDDLVGIKGGVKRPSEWGQYKSQEAARQAVIDAYRKRGEDEKPTQPAKHAWATEDTLNQLLEIMRGRLGVDGLTLKEMADLANIRDALDCDNWNRVYPTGAAAGAAIKGAFNSNNSKQKHEDNPAPQQKREEKWDEDAVERLERWIMSQFYMTPGEVMSAINRHAWTDFANPSMAYAAILERAQLDNWPLMADTVTEYDGKAAVLNTAVPVLVYGRDTFRALGEDWQADVNAWKDAGTTFPRKLLAPVLVQWQKPKSGESRYATQLSVMKPIEDAPDNAEAEQVETNPEREPEPETVEGAKTDMVEALTLTPGQVIELPGHAGPWVISKTEWNREMTEVSITARNEEVNREASVTVPGKQLIAVYQLIPF